MLIFKKKKMTGRIAINFSIHVPFRMMCKSDHLMVNLSLTSHQNWQLIIKVIL